MLERWDQRINLLNLLLNYSKEPFWREEKYIYSLVTVNRQTIVMAKPEYIEIVLLRHGDTGCKGRYIGSTNVGLSAEGKAQVQKVGRQLRHIPFDTILVSPMKRCVDTVELLEIDFPFKIIDSLREVDFGEWEGKTFSEICEASPELVDKWTKESGNFTFPSGESLSDFKARVDTVAQMLYTSDNPQMLIVSHGGVIRHLICFLLKLDPANYLLFDILPGHYTTLRLHPEGGVMTGLNFGN